ncbi:MAG TPA: EAL domain-containing protein [Vicinamibacterales bacterium]|nr:EAL domain-containing protein [Vicinamibacterales bacterium]
MSASVAVAAAVGLHVLGFSPWAAQPQASLVAFLAAVAIVGLCVLLEPPRFVADPGGTMRLSFVGDVTALLLFGPIPMTLVATVGALARAVVDPQDSQRIRRTLLEVITVGAATQAAGVAHTMLGGAPAPLAWPFQGLPLAGAVVAYCFITCAVADVIAPLATGAATTRNWPRHALRGCPGHFIGAALSVSYVELVGHEAWSLLLLASVPLYFAWTAYRAHADRLGRQDRRLDAIRSTDHGVCIVDDNGRVTHWNDWLARHIDCAAPRAVGRTLAEAVPALSLTPLPAAVDHAIATRTACSLAGVSLATGAGSRTVHVTVIPDAEGVLLMWLDVSGQAAADHALRVNAARFALVAAGGNDGIWEVDETTRSVFVSSRWNEILGVPAGANDLTRDSWIERVHPDDRDALVKVLDTIVRGRVPRADLEHRIRHEDGSYRRVLVRCLPTTDAAGRVVRVAGTLTDITETAMALERIESAGTCDPLTGLLNRQAFVEKLGRRLDDYKERHGRRFAALHLDLDRFKVVNDSLGHLIGDELLLAVSRRLESCLRPGDAIARLGGDEFAVMLQDITDEMQANVVAFRVQEALQAPFPIGGREVVTSASIGIAISRVEHTNPEQMMRDADTAMYHAKTHGKARHELFDTEMHHTALDRLGLETDLRHAVKSTGFEVHYQPIVSLTTRMVTGFESLVRWNRNGKPVSPADFIPMAEELGIIEPLGTWVLQQACQKFVEWKQRFPQANLDCITVNVSARQLVQQGFIYLVEQTVERNGMNPADLRLEITETALMDAPQFAAQVLAELRQFGVKIYLDDFGTGYSSLSHLHKLPVDALKIDRSFVRNLLMEDRPAIVESILALARTLHTNVVAEGIEEERQALELERLGCRQAQGYLFSRPVPAEKIEEMLAAGVPLGAPRSTAVIPVRASLRPVRSREIA